jgi:Multiubiquitin
MSHDKEKFKIFVGQDEHEINTPKISYQRVVELYLGQGGKPSTEYLVKYSHGPAENPKGTLTVGQEVEVKDGMRFRVSGAGES